MSINVGDKVKVTRRAADYEAGWNGQWYGEAEQIADMNDPKIPVEMKRIIVQSLSMDDYLKGEHVVINISPLGVELGEEGDEPNTGFAFPMHVLEKV